MITVEKKQTRPDKNIPFYTMEQSVENKTEFQQYFFTNYIATGKFLSGEKQISEDELTLTIISIWSDSEAVNDFKYDSTVKLHFHDPKELYLQANGMTEELVKYDSL